MSCENVANKLTHSARVSGAIPRLSSKQAFFAGVATGGISGASMGALLATVWQKRKKTPLQKPISLSRVSKPKPKPKPIPGLSPGVSRPKPTPGLSSKPRPIPGLPQVTTPILSGNIQLTKLQTAPVRILSDGKLYEIKNSYRVQRADGSDTGLAITSDFEKGEDGQITEKKSVWSVTHIGTGTLIDGPFTSLDQAHGLAAELTPLRWTTPALSAADVTKAKKIVEQYQRGLDQKKKDLVNTS